MIRFSLALLACFLAAGCTRAATGGGKPLDLKFTAVDGRKVDLADDRGKVVLIDFWATWCPPCRILGPDIKRLYDKYHGQGLEVIGISADSDKSALLKYVKDEGVPWPQYFDDAGDQVLLQKLGIDSFPTLWLINRQGVVVNPDFRDLWSVDGGLRTKTAPETLARVDAAIAAQLKAP
jgi:thiol-disulfide isomerase/thioredoxin